MLYVKLILLFRWLFGDEWTRNSNTNSKFIPIKESCFHNNQSQNICQVISNSFCKEINCREKNSCLVHSPWTFTQNSQKCRQDNSQHTYYLRLDYCTPNERSTQCVESPYAVAPLNKLKTNTTLCKACAVFQRTEHAIC